MPPLRSLTALLLAASLSPAVLAPGAGAEVALPDVIGSRMVLQRDMPVPVWGTAAPFRTDAW